jgi:hypothetical protein
MDQVSGPANRLPTSLFDKLIGGPLQTNGPFYDFAVFTIFNSLGNSLVSITGSETVLNATRVVTLAALMIKPSVFIYEEFRAFRKADTRTQQRFIASIIPQDNFEID